MTEQEQKRELSNTTFVKTILMLLVVLGHSLCFWGGNWFTKNPVEIVPPLSLIADWLNTFHIYAFALVSGYLFYYLKYEKKRYVEFPSFVWNKFKRLIVPYLFVSIVWAIPFAAFLLGSDVKSLIESFGLGLAPGQLWFLLMLFFVFLIFYPLSDFFVKHRLMGAIVVLLVYGIGIIGGPNLFQFFRACRYLPFFWMGFLLRRSRDHLLRKIPAWLWILSHVLLFVLWRSVSGFEGRVFSILEMGIEFVLNAVGALMAFFVLQKIANRGKWQTNKVFLFFSKHSMPVYLFHQEIIYVLISAMNGAISPYLHAGINFIGSLAISLLISVLLSHYKFSRFLIGEK